MRSGLFTRIFLLYGSIMVLAVVGAELTVTRAVRTSTFTALHDNLVVQAKLIALSAPFDRPAPLDAFARRLKASTEARVTLIAGNGRVLGDSDHDAATMDNHRDRLEIQQADLTGTGMAVRWSDTLRTDLLYVAYKVDRNDGPPGFVRMSLPLTNVNAMVRRVRMSIVGAVLGVLAVTSLVILWQIDRLRRLTVQVRDFSSAVAAGDLGRRLFLHKAGEFEVIADGLNSMATSLSAEVKSLRDEKAKFETALLGISDGVLLLDRSGRVELANRAFRDMFQISGEIGGKPFLEVVRNHVLADRVREAHEHHRPSSAEIAIVLPQQLTLLATALPIIHEQGGDRYRGTVVALHDITQLKRLEQTRKDFVANVSHEIKTPITSIQGFAETLLSGALEDPANARKFLETIRANSQRINSLVDDLMTISRIELGVITVEKAAVAFDDIADAVLSLLRDKAERKGISLAVSLPHDMGMIQADRDRLVQIMTNLVDNAIKFTDAGGVTFGMREENGRTAIFVQDTGIGIPERHLPRLGERFYRVDTARSRTMGGTGLGLAIVKHLVRAHGWDLRIESVVGKGTVVSIMIA